MSWLARSIANSLLIDDDDNDDTDANNIRRQNPPSIASENDGDDATKKDDNVIREEFDGAKDDLSEFKESLTRQLWGVANFLAPPPPPPPQSSSRKSHDRRFVPAALNRIESTDPSISGDEGDESSIDGRNSVVDSGIRGLNERNLGDFKPKLSFNGLRLQNVEENDEDHDDDDEDDDDDWINEAVGLTEEVLTFAGNIAHHPETWLDFPVEDDEDIEDFPMSESQKRHAQAIEHLTPRLAALRIELCPAHMSVEFFWKVYFVLLHSRLHKQDAELLSTPEIVEARAKWMQEQQKRSKKESEWFHTGLFSRGSADLDDDGTPRSFQNDHSETFSSWTFASEPATSSTTVDSDVEKHGTEPQFIDKSILVEKSLPDSDDKKSLGAPISMKSVLSFVVDDDDGDDWPEDDFLGQNDRPIPVGIEDEVSFSDLEDDDCCIPVVSKP